VSALEAHDYVQARTAKALGVSRTTLGKWLRRLGIRRPADLGADEIRATLDCHGGDVARAAAALGVSERGLRLRLTALAGE